MVDEPGDRGHEVFLVDPGDVVQPVPGAPRRPDRVAADGGGLAAPAGRGAPEAGRAPRPVPGADAAAPPGAGRGAPAGLSRGEDRLRIPPRLLRDRLPVPPRKPPGPG